LKAIAFQIIKTIDFQKLLLFFVYLVAVESRRHEIAHFVKDLILAAAGGENLVELEGQARRVVFKVTGVVVCHGHGTGTEAAVSTVVSAISQALKVSQGVDHGEGRLVVEETKGRGTGRVESISL